VAGKRRGKTCSGTQKRERTTTQRSAPKKGRWENLGPQKEFKNHEEVRGKGKNKLSAISRRIRCDNLFERSREGVFNTESFAFEGISGNAQRSGEGAPRHQSRRNKGMQPQKSKNGLSSHLVALKSKKKNHRRILPRRTGRRREEEETNKKSAKSLRKKKYQEKKIAGIKGRRGCGSKWSIESRSRIRGTEANPQYNSGIRAPQTETTQ